MEDPTDLSEPTDRSDPAPRTPIVPVSFRHLTGLRAAATVAAGAALGAGGLALLRGAARGEPGWAFLALAGVSCACASLLVATLPVRLATTISGEGLTLGWLFGRTWLPWSAVRRAVVGPLGTGGERDPTVLSLFLADRSDLLVAVLGGRRAEDVPEVRAVLEACRARGIPVDAVVAPLAERKERERKWRVARIKGWR